MHYCFGECELDDQLYHLRRAGQPVDIEPKVFDVLVYLLHHRDRIVSKDELLDKLWPGQVVSETALTRCIVAARKAVGDDGDKQQIIKTQHGRGYRFVAPLTTNPHPVQSSTFQVPSQEEKVSSQSSGVSRQPAKGENGLDSSVQSLGSDEQRRPVTEQTLDPRPSDSRLSDLRRQTPDDSSGQTLDPRRQTLDAATPSAQRPWLIRRFVLMGLLLLVGISVVVQYLSLPTPNPQSPTPSPQSLPLPDKPSLVVLPFTNLSGDPAQEYFSDGITEDLTNGLSRISSLFVIARNSAFTYKGKAVKVQDVSKELGVRYVLEGSVLRADNRVRITAQLIDATTGYHLWSERYDQPFTDIFMLQDKITQKIVLALKVKLTREEQERFRLAPTDNLEAYDYYLRGLESFVRAFREANREANAQARQMYEKALALDPRYAAAYAGLGLTYLLDWFYVWNPDRAQLPERAFELAQRAVALNDSLPEPHRVLSQVYLWKKQHDQAIVEAEQTITLDPNFADGYSNLGAILVMAGRPEEGIGLIEKAMRLNPQYPPTYLMQLGFAYREAGRCEEALAPLKRAVALAPDFTPTHYSLAACYAELNRLEEARAEVTEILRTCPNCSLEITRQMFAGKYPAALERYLAALRKAGLK